MLPVRFVRCSVFCAVGARLIDAQRRRATEFKMDVARSMRLNVCGDCFGPIYWSFEGTRFYRPTLRCRPDGAPIVTNRSHRRSRYALFQWKPRGAISVILNVLLKTMQQILWSSGDYTFFDFDTFEFYWHVSLERHVQRLEFINPYTQAVTRGLIERAIPKKTTSEWIRQRASALSVTQGTGKGRSEPDWKLHFAIMYGLTFHSTLEYRHVGEELEVCGRSIDECSFQLANSQLLISLYENIAEPS